MRGPIDTSSPRAQALLDRLRSIERGRVTTYGDLSPEAPRYAGAVLAAHPDPDVPWQRVVRADGSLTQGERQRRLLEARACRSTASAWTCAPPGWRRARAGGAAARSQSSLGVRGREPPAGV